jgi:hypothetical protein
MTTPSPADIAGAITITLRLSGGIVSDVELRSSRPTDFSRRLFRGRAAGDLLQIVPRVFSVCATAQCSAAVQAVERATGFEPAPQHRAARELLVAAETAREHLFRILIGWSAWLGVPPDATRLPALGRMRLAWDKALYPDGDGFVPGGGSLDPNQAALDAAMADARSLLALALGGAADDWKSLDDEASLAAWATSGDAVAARMLRHVRDERLSGLGRTGVTLLPATADADLLARLTASDVDDFVAAPTWGGEPCETSALQRNDGAPVVAALREAYGNGVLTRQVARLEELVATIDRMAQLLDAIGSADPAGELPLASGNGIAQVEAARGRLVHRIEMNAGTVSDYAILAPTEWNFHPRGALARGLLGLAAGPDLQARAQLLVDAIDPCVEAHIAVIEEDVNA